MSRDDEWRFAAIFRGLGLPLNGSGASQIETKVANALQNVLHEWFPHHHKPTLGDLAAIPPEKWKRVRNLGKKSIAILRERLANNGLGLTAGEATPQKRLGDAQAAETFRAAVRRFRRLGREVLIEIVKAEVAA